MLYKQLLAITILFSWLSAANNTSSSSNVAIYWGQNSIGYLSNFKNNEKELWWYCNWDNIDVIMLAFMHEFPGSYSTKHGMKIPTLNFPHHTNSEFSANKTGKMSRIASDIKYCQKKKKKIILSLGGELGKYGFSSEAEATEFGHTLWEMFGEGKHNKSVPRPFGDSVIDGFDFDIETPNSVGYVPLIQTLQNYTQNATKKYYYTAAPQCPYPDQNLNTILSDAHLDMVFVQFYNNKCNANTEGSFNWNTWSTFAKNTSLNPDVGIYLGLPGSVNSLSTGYINSTSSLTSVINQVKNDTHFAGVMLWEASLSFQNKLKDSKKSYPQTVKDILTKGTSTSSANALKPDSSTLICFAISVGLLLTIV